MELRLPQSVRQGIGEHAITTLPEECCGFLLGEREGETILVREVRMSTNVHPRNREERYTIDPHSVLEVERGNRTSRRLTGFYHSHPNRSATPSEHDRRSAWPWYAYVIVEVRDARVGEVRAWMFDTDEERFHEIALTVE